jgi:hypothetical protein
MQEFDYQPPAKGAGGFRGGVVGKLPGTLGLIFVIIGDLANARVYLQEALENSVALQNPIGRYHSQIGLAYCRYADGQIGQAYQQPAGRGGCG